MPRSQSSADGARATWLDGVLLFGLFFFAFTYRSSGGVYWLGLLLLAVWWFRVRPSAPPLPRWMIHCTLAYLAIWCGHALWVLWRGEYPLVETLVAYRHYAELTLFIPLSVALWHARQHLIWLLWVPVVAVVVRMLHRTDYSDLAGTFLNTEHYGFGTHHVTFGMHATLALICGVALLGLTQRRIASPARRRLFWLAVCLALALLLQGLVTSGSRGAWICTSVGLLALLWSSRRHLLLHTTQRLRRGVGLLGVFVVAVVVFGSYEKIQHRFSVTSDVGVRWLALDQMDRTVDIFPDRRIFLAAYGVERWVERPVMGHGPAAVPVFLQQDPDFHIHPHLHNTYVQVLVEGGVVGAGAFVLLLLALIRGVLVHSPRQGLDARQLRWLLGAVLLSWALWNLPNFHLHNSDWRFTWNWFAAIAAFLMRLQTAGVTVLEHRGPTA
ncbi:MAG: O-antigen ligase family protein [Pseudomonadota bacterium]